MKKILQILSLAAMLCVPWATGAQNNLTVADGTANSSLVPFDGYNADGAQHNQMLYPSADLTVLSGKDITQMVFYIDQSQSNGTYTAADRLGTWTVSLGETNATSLTALDNSTSLTQVYQGYFDCSTGTLTIEFDNSYRYNGGNLLVDLDHSAAGWNRWYFLGEEVSGAAYTNGSARNFLPKTTFIYETPSACAKPSGLTITGITHNTATVSWTGNGYNGVTYSVMQGNNTLASDLTATSYTISGLSATTTYAAGTYTVVADCGNDGMSTAVNVPAFTTLCAPYSIAQYQQYIESFEDLYNAGDIPDCWTKVGSGTVNVQSSTSNAHESTMYLRFSGSTSNLILLPMMAEEISTLQLKFWTRPESNTSSSCGTFSVGYVTNSADASTFVEVANYSYNDWASAAHEQKTVLFTSAPAGARMAMRHNAGATYYYWYVDDVTVEEAPNCVLVSGVTVSNITTTGATISWVTTNAATATYTISDGANLNVTTAAGATSYTLTTLNPATTYNNLTITANCSAQEQSDPATVPAFTTNCEAVASISENFDGYTTGNNVLPTCWKYINTTTYNSYKGYPKVYNYGANSPSNCLYFYSYFSTYTDYDPQDQYAILPEMTGVAGKEIVLNAKGSSTAISFKIGWMTDPTDASTFTEIATQALTTSYQEFTFLVPANATGNYIAIMMEGANSTTTTKTVYIDDVTVQTPPSCRPVQNITFTNVERTSLTANWENHPLAQNVSSYQVVISEDNMSAQDLESANKVTCTTATHTFTELTRATHYHVYVRANCGNDGYGEWVEGEVMTRDLDPDCTASSEGTVSSGTNNIQYMPWGDFYKRYYTQQIYTAAELTAAGLSAGYISKVAFQYILSTAYTKEVTIYMGTTNDAAFANTSFKEVSAVTTATSVTFDTENQWYEFEFNEPFYWDGVSNIIVGGKFVGTNYPSSGTATFKGGTTNAYMALYSRADSSDPSTATGTQTNNRANIVFTVCPMGSACPPVTNVQVSNISEHSATVSWTPSTGDYVENSTWVISEYPIWEDILTEEADNPQSYLDFVETQAGDENFVSPNGLTAYTQYYFYVRANCAGRDGSSSWDSVNFRTASACRVPTNIAFTQTGRQTGTVTWQSGDANQSDNYDYILYSSVPPVEPNDNTQPTASGITTTSVDLSNLTCDNHYYFYVRNNCGNTGYSPWVLYEFETYPELPAVVNLQATQVTHSAISLSWNRNYAQFANENQWEVHYCISANCTTQYAYTSDSSITLIGLAPATEYSIEVFPKFGNTVGQYGTSITVSTLSEPSPCVQIGEGSLSAILLYTSWGNTYSQHIYTAAELEAAGYNAGSITSVSFNYTGTSSNFSKTQSVYIGTTTNDAFAGSAVSNLVPANNMTLVYGPTLNSYVSGWREYEFNEPFVWDGQSNIVVGVLSNSTDNSASGWSVQGTNVSAYRTNYRYRDNTEIDITDESTMSSGSWAQSRPNIKFCFERTSDCWDMTNITVSNVTTEGARISWMPANRETDWEYFLSDHEVIELPPAGYSYGIWTMLLSLDTTDLEADHDYWFYIRPLCYNYQTQNYDNGNWAVRTFRTTATCGVPTLLAATNVTATTATLNATPHATIGTAAGYTFRYWTAGNEDNKTTATSANLTDLTPNTTYYYDVKVSCTGNDGDSRWTEPMSFTTKCAAVTQFPWSDDFEIYATGNFSDNCWVNEHISGNGTYIFNVSTDNIGGNSTKKMKLPDQTAGTLTKLVLPQMAIPSADYLFVLDVYRSNSTYSNTYASEGIRVYLSTDGEIEGATELAFIPRQYTVSNNVIPAETAVGWYTYKLPLGVTGNYYIILRGESQYCTATYTDNYVVRQIEQYTVTTNVTMTVEGTPQPMGSISSTPATLTNVNENTQITLVATPNTGYGFVNWTDNHGTEMGTDNTLTFVLSGDSVITANFDSLTYNLTATCNDPLMGRVSPADTTVKYNRPVNFVATPNTCYEFVQWNTANGDSVTNTPTLTVNGTANMAYTAVFRQRSITGDTAAVACDEFDWYEHENLTASSTNLTHTFTSTEGCDSTVTLNLTIKNSTTGTETADVCDTYTWAAAGNYQAVTYTESNNSDQRVLQNAVGCDSTVTLNLTVRKSTRGDTTAVACDVFEWYGNSYNMTPVTDLPTHTFVAGNAAGCDSTVTLDLTIKRSKTGDTAAVACDQFSWYEHTNLTASSNNLTHTFVNEDGCDSVVTLTLTINNSSVGDTAAVACDQFSWYEHTNLTTSSNNLTHTFENAVGCDSVVTLTLTINNSNTGDTTVVACDEFQWINQMTYNATPDVAPTATLTNAVGCDSVVTLHLTINNSSTGIDKREACNSYEWINGRTYTTSNDTAVYTLTNAAGCDSVVTLNLVINSSSTGDTTVVACDEFQWINQVTYTSTPVTAAPTFTLQNEAGCDSTVTLHLTINNSSTGDTNAVACDRFDWYEHTNLTSSSDNLTHTFVNNDGCDSVVTLHLTINNSNLGDTTVVACDQYTWINQVTYDATPDVAPTFTLPSANVWGCDSTVTLYLTINTSTTGVDNQTACDNYEWINGRTYTASNDTAVYIIENGNAMGCDSTVTLNLTINNSSTGTETVTACDSYTWHGTEYTVSNNTATYSTTNGANCDSTVTLNLTINYSTSNVDTVIICNGYVWQGAEVTESGIYTATSTNNAGCTHIDSLVLTVNKPVHQSVTEVACGSYTWNNTEYTQSGEYTYSHPDANNCDQVDTLHLTINNSTTGDTTVVACDEFTWINQMTYTATPDVAPTFTLQNAVGCDSVVTLNLTVNHSTDTAITVEILENQLPYTFNGETFQGAVTNRDITIENAAGCDSVIHFTLNVEWNSTNTVDSSICASQLPFSWNNTIFTEAGTQSAVLPGGNGADSIVVMTLNVYPQTGSDTAATACDNFTWYGEAYAVSNDSLTHSLTDVNGCDSIIILNLTINNSNTGVEDTMVCDEFTWINQVTYTATPDVAPTFTLQNAAGCDSVVTLNLTVNHSTEVADTVTICNGYVWHGEEITVSGEYTNVSENQAGCPHTETLVLTVNVPVNETFTVAACNSYTWNYTEYNQSGEYTFSHTDNNSCTQVDTLRLTISNSVVDSVEVVACDSYQWTYAIEPYMESGRYVVASENEFGCSETHILNLTINHSTEIADTVTICNGYLWHDTVRLASGLYTYVTENQYGCPQTETLLLAVNLSVVDSVDTTVCNWYVWNDTMLGESGRYVATSVSAQGCTDTHILNLTVNYNSSYAFSQEAVGSFEWYDSVYTESGTYTHVLTNAAGCDSVINMTLTITPDTTTTICPAPANITVTTTTTTATFDWDRVDPDQGYIFNHGLTIPGFPRVYITPPYTVTGLEPGTTYTVTVCGYCDTNDVYWWTVDTASSCVTVTFTTDVDTSAAFICDTVTNVTIAGVTDSSITVNFTTTDAPEYDVHAYVGLTDIMVTTTTGSATITGLQPSTTYYIKVQSHCVNENVWSIMPEAIEVTTAAAVDPCLVTELPWNEGFEGVTGTAYSTAGVMPDCWTVYSTGTNAAYIPHVVTGNSSYSYQKSGINSLALLAGTSATYGTPKYAILPEMARALNELQLSFWMCTEGSTGTLTVGYVTGDDTTGFTPINSYAASTATQHSGNGVQAQGVGQDVLLYLNAVPATAKHLVFKWDVALSYYTCCIDDIVIDELPSCYIVENLVVDGVTSSSMTLTWNDNLNNGATYSVYNGEALVASGITDTTYTVTGLVPNTQYTFGVVANCSANDASDAVSVSGTTMCTAVQIPYSENFDAITTSTTTATGVHVDCWSYTMTGTSSYQGTTYQPQVYYSATYANSGNYSLRLYGVSYTCLPQMAEPLSGLQLTFNAHTTSASTNKLAVGVMEGETFVPVDTISVGSHVPCTVYFSGYNGNSRIIAFRNFNTSATGNTSTHYIDDVMVDYLPSCMPVTNLEVVSVSDASVTLEWVDQLNNGATYTVSDASGVIASGLTNTTYAVVGLNANTDYTFYVTANCSATASGDAVSVTAHTTCTPFTMPFTENFDSITSGIPECWDNNEGTVTTASYRWNYYATGYEGHGLRFNSYTAPNGQINVLASPAVAVTADSRLTFWYKNSTGGDFTVMAAIDGGVRDTLATGLTGVSEWTLMNIPLPTTYNGHNVVVYFKGTSNYGSGDAYIYLDDVTIEAMPSCVEVSNLVASDVTHNSVTLTWTDANNTGATYTVYDMSDSTVLGNGITGTSYTVTGLTHSTDYIFGVRANCSVDDASPIMTVSARTTCGAMSLPFTEDFSNTLTGNPCWISASNATAAQVFAGTALTPSTTGWTYASAERDGLPAGHYYRNVYGTTCKHWLITPEIDLTTVNGAELSFDVALTDFGNAALPDANGDTNSSQAFMVIVSTDGGQTWNASNATVWQNGVGDYSFASLASLSYQNKVIDLTPYVGNTVRIAFYTQSLWSGGDNDLHIDNIAVTGTSVPLCDTVTGTTITAVTDNSISVTFNTTDAPSYDVHAYVGMTDIMVTTTTGSATITGLHPNTTYYVAVQAHCGNVWSILPERIAVTTLAEPVIDDIATVPYICDFEEQGNNGWVMIDSAQTNHWMIGSATNNGGNQSMYITNDDTSNAYTVTTTSYAFATRQIRIAQAGSYLYSFNWKAQGESSYDFIRAALMPDSVALVAGQYNGFNNTTAVPTGSYALDGGRLNLNGEWQTREGEINVTDTGVYKMVFMWRNDNSSGTQPPAAIDNVTFVVNSCPMVQNVVAEATSTSVTLTWTAGGSETSWEVACGTESQIVNTNSHTFSGLTANTEYAYSVRAICGAGDSSLVNSGTVRTGCAVETLPFVEDFSTTVSSNPCWRGANGTTAAEVFAGAALPLTTPDWSYASSTSNGLDAGHYYKNIYASSYSSCKSWIITPAIALTGVTTAQLTFDAAFTTYSGAAAATGFDTNSSQAFMVIVSTDGGQTWLESNATKWQNQGGNYTLASLAGTNYINQVINLNQYIGDTIKIAFYAQSLWSGGDNNIHIDNIIVSEVPSCPSVMGLTLDSQDSASANISWNSNGASSYEVQVTHNGDVDTSVTVAVNDTTAHIGGLMVDNDYQVAVRAICGTNAGLWSMPINIHIGYCQPNPTSVDAQGITSVSFGGMTNTTSHPTAAPYYINNASMSGSVPAGTPATVEITYATGYTYGTIIWIDWNRSMTFDADEVVYAGESTNANPTTLTATFNIPATTATGSYRMRIAGADSYFNNYINNVTGTPDPCFTSTYAVAEDYTLIVTEAPACLAPSNLEAVYIGGSNNAAVISWVSDAAAFNISVNGTVTYNVNNPDTLTGLDANTTYTVMVQSNCGTDTSAWSIPVSFTTPCAAVELPYTETFDSVSTTRDCWTLEATGNIGGTNGMGFFTINNRETLRFSSYANANDYNQYAYSPLMNVSNDANALNVSITYATYGSTDSLWFGYVTATDTVWNSNSFTTGGSSDFQTYSTMIPADATQIAIHYYGNFKYYAWIDTVAISEITGGVCYQVTNLTVDSVTTNSVSLSWSDADNSGATYTVYNDTTVVATGVTATNYTVTDLTVNTQYTFGVVANCSATDASTMATITTRTACNSVAIPYVEDFENDIDCWTMANVSASTGVNTTYPYSGTHAFKFNWNTNPPQYLISPELIGTENGLNVSFMYRAGGANYAESFQLGYSTTTNDISAFVWGTEVDSITSTTYAPYNETLPAGTKYVAIKYTAYDMLALYVDSLVFDSPVAQPDSVMVIVSPNFPAHGAIDFNGAVSTNAANAFFHEGDTIVATAIPDSGYLFDYWAVSYVTSDTALITVSDTVYTNPFVLFVDNSVVSNTMITIKANFRAEDGTADSMTVVLATADATRGTTNPQPGTYRVALGDTLWMNSVAYDGYHFMHWTYEIVGLSSTPTIVSEDTLTCIGQQWLLDRTINLVAYFAPDSVADTTWYTVNVVYDSTMGEVTGAGVYAEGDTATLTATPNEGYMFVAWRNANGGLVSTDNNYSFVVVDDVTLAAHFVSDTTNVDPDSVTFVISVNESMMGSTTPLPGIYRIAVGDSAAAMAVANEGYHFEYWVVSIMGLSDTLYQPVYGAVIPGYLAGMTINATAYFAEDSAIVTTYHVVGVPSDSTMGYVLGSGPYVEGSVATLTARSYDGYRFVGWSNGDTSATLQIIVISDTTFIAYFEAIDGIEDADAIDITVWSTGMRILVKGAEGRDVRLFDVNGRLISTATKVSETTEFRVNASGVYLIKVDRFPAKRVLVVR